MTDEAGHQEKGTKRKRVENELMTKIENMPCGSQYLCNTFKQELVRGWLMSEGSRSTKAEVKLVGSDSIKRFDATLNSRAGKDETGCVV